MSERDNHHPTIRALEAYEKVRPLFSLFDLARSLQLPKEDRSKINTAVRDKLVFLQELSASEKAHFNALAFSSATRLGKGDEATRQQLELWGFTSEQIDKFFQIEAENLIHSPSLK